MKKTRITVAVTAALLSAVLLFGGYMIYDKVAVAAPIEEAISKLPDVIAAEKPVMDSEQVTISIELTENANLREIYGSISKDAADAIGDRKLELDVQTESDPELESVWQSALFAVAEAMDTKSYSDIPEAMDKAAAAYDNVTVTTEMDENNVYITLKNDSAEKYVVLPRVPVQLEVWTNA